MIALRRFLEQIRTWGRRVRTALPRRAYGIRFHNRSDYSGPYHYILGCDRSGSGVPSLRETRAAAEEAIREIWPKERTEVVVFWFAGPRT